MLDGHRPKNVKVRQASSGLRRHWDVELVITYGHMYLCHGWEQFYRAYDLWHGYFLLFRYDGNAMLTVKVFNTTMCRMRYQDDDDASTFCLFFLYICNGSSNSDSGYSQSSSDSGCSKSSSEDDSEWSGEEE
ncbi:B3 domain-containing protein Os03g0212300-like [Aegilops tauschii subsp. strangulata]|uniref:B3 domain-containing protein Os03g0212300-like n=1 Tax=Aegilops tauschii subsp. strangulata TaxID=200361 RepID=UPI00098B8AD0|nr:B3 domain-containing protein Os03g0212300-like [Aegilops tauschii subsp. strangulata]